MGCRCGGDKDRYPRSFGALPSSLVSCWGDETYSALTSLSLSLSLFVCSRRSFMLAPHTPPFTELNECRTAVVTEFHEARSQFHETCAIFTKPNIVPRQPTAAAAAVKGVPVLPGERAQLRGGLKICVRVRGRRRIHRPLLRSNRAPMVPTNSSYKRLSGVYAYRRRSLFVEQMMMCLREVSK